MTLNAKTCLDFTTEFLFGCVVVLATLIVLLLWMPVIAGVLFISIGTERLENWAYKKPQPDEAFLAQLYRETKWVVFRR